jgi:hypothetical protein
MYLESPQPKCIRTVWDVEVIKAGVRSPFPTPCSTLTEAREIASKMSRAGGAEIVNLDFRHDIKNETRDGIFICEIRQDVAQMGWPRIYS